MEIGAEVREVGALNEPLNEKLIAPKGRNIRRRIRLGNKLGEVNLQKKKSFLRDFPCYTM